VRHRRNEILFFTLLATLVAAPLLAPYAAGTLILQGILGVNLIAALARERGRVAVRGMLVAVAVLIPVRIAADWLGHPLVSGIALTLLAATALVAAVWTVRFALEGDKVDSEHVFAALSAYLLAGIFCGVLYWQVEKLSPGSILVAGASGQLPLPAAVYFSFMTLATVGYGDIIPASELARGLVTLEAVAGQLYVAVMIARLLTLYAGPRKRTG
jgi:hypothetical protein